jgi:hypothetical protein
MQPAPQLVAYRASRSTSSMRRFAAAAVGVALLLVAAVALASSQASSSSLAAPAEALPADKEVAATEASTTHVHKKQAIPARLSTRVSRIKHKSICIIFGLTFPNHTPQVIQKRRHVRQRVRQRVHGAREGCSSPQLPAYNEKLPKPPIKTPKPPTSPPSTL